jgi:serine/threonine protein kinase
MSDATRTSLEPESMVSSYRISHSLASGGMAEVFEAQHAVLPRRVALKVMHPELLRKQDMDTRFMREACILESFSHPGGVRVFECGVLPDGRPWLAMELVRGHAMSKEMHTPMDPAAVVSILSSVTEVLASAHAVGLIHRDLKPDNLLLSDDPDGYPVRVIDWGLARLESNTRLTQDGTAAGTPLYMAPEQTQGKPLDGRCDIYALGVVAYEALAGVPPFDGQNLVEIVVRQVTTEPVPLCQLRPEIPKCLSDLVALMLSRDPKRRPTATDLMPLLAAVAEGLVAHPCRQAASDLEDPIVEYWIEADANELLELEIEIHVEMGELTETPTAKMHTHAMPRLAEVSPPSELIELTQPRQPVRMARAPTRGLNAASATALLQAANKAVSETYEAVAGGTISGLTSAAALALMKTANDDDYDDSFDDPINDGDESSGVPMRDQTTAGPHMHWTPEPLNLDSLGLGVISRRRRRCEITPRGPSDQAPGQVPGQVSGDLMVASGGRRNQRPN